MGIKSDHPWVIHHQNYRGSHVSPTAPPEFSKRFGCGFRRWFLRSKIIRNQILPQVSVVFVGQLWMFLLPKLHFSANGLPWWFCGRVVWNILGSPFEKEFLISRGTPYTPRFGLSQTTGPQTTSWTCWSREYTCSPHNLCSNSLPAVKWIIKVGAEVWEFLAPFSGKRPWRP